MKLFHPKYSGTDVGVGGTRYRVQPTDNGGAHVDVPDAEAHLLFEHGFREATPLADDKKVRSKS